MYYSAHYIAESEYAGVADMSTYLQLNCLGYYEFEQFSCERYRQQGRTDYMLIYHHEGKATVRSRGVDYEVKDGTAVIYRPGEEHLYRVSDERPIKSYWVHFTGYGVEELLGKLGIADQNIYYTGPANQFAMLSGLARSEIQADRLGCGVYISGLLAQMLALIARQFGQSSLSGKQQETNSHLELSISYMHAHYAKPLTVPELAGLACLSVSRYIHLFKARTGVTPKDYLIKLRIDKAKELLRDTGLTIRQISLIVGFSDQLYFSRMFKKATGQSPREARGAADFN